MRKPRRTLLACFLEVTDRLDGPGPKLYENPVQLKLSLAPPKSKSAVA